jgi:hypothetical protein
MKCVEAALKSSFRKEIAPKLSPQTFLDELSAFNVVQNNVATSCDDFFVDQLLDFSHEEELLLQEEEQQPQQQNHGSSSSVSVSPQQKNQNPQICNPSFNDNFGSLPPSELTVPVLKLKL